METVTIGRDSYRVGQRHGITSKTARLRGRLVTKSFQGDDFKDPRVLVDLEKLRYYTESWKKTEGLPVVIRRAKALENIFDNATIFINDDELLVGYPGSTPASIYMSPERPREIAEELDVLGHVPDAEKRELYELLDYWDGKRGQDRMRKYFNDEEWAIYSAKSMIWTLGADYTQRAAPDWERIFALGLSGILSKIGQKMAEVESETRKVNNLQRIQEHMRTIEFLEAMTISVKAMQRWASRYSGLAAWMAEREMDPKRREELLRISTTCGNVPANPARTFQEALQVYAFIWIVTHSIDHECHGTSERIDQIFWPQYERDVILDRRLSRQEAQELVECLWLKINEVGRLLPRSTRLSHQGTNNNNAATIGGQKPNGEDACNELTEVVLDAVNSIRVYQPSVAFRYHAKASPSALLKAFEVVRTGLGYPSFKNDDVNIAHLMDMGYSLEEARDWALIGCMSPGVVGKWGTVKRNAWHLNIAKCLEITLNNGRCMLTGKRLGPETGEPSNFKTYEEFRSAFREQVRAALTLGMRLHNVSLAVQAEMYPRPFLSALFEDSLEYGEDLMGVSRKSLPWINLVAGTVDVADALSAIKKLVFEERRISLTELVEILRKDWDGFEEIRQMFVNDAPKFGNDNDFADSVARDDVFHLAVEEMSKLRDIWGVAPKSLPQAVTGAWSMGWLTSALPNGRKARTVLSDGGISPYYGYDRKGPTAVLLSVSKIDHRKHKGVLLNQRLDPRILYSEKGPELFLSYLKTWHDLGIDHVQFNVVDSETLKAAQKEPEKYADLMVRVAGYSALFVELPKEYQDAIIARTVQETQ